MRSEEEIKRLLELPLLIGRYDKDKEKFSGFVIAPRTEP